MGKPEAMWGRFKTFLVILSATLLTAGAVQAQSTLSFCPSPDKVAAKDIPEGFLPIRFDQEPVAPHVYEWLYAERRVRTNCVEAEGLDQCYRVACVYGAERLVEVDTPYGVQERPEWSMFFVSTKELVRKMDFTKKYRGGWETVCVNIGIDEPRPSCFARCGGDLQYCGF